MRETPRLKVPFAEYAGFADAIGRREEEKQREAREIFRRISPKLALRERVAIAVAWRRFADGDSIEWAELNAIITRALDGELEPGWKPLPF